MSTFCLTIDIARADAELVVSVLSSNDVLGFEEKECGGGYLVLAYYPDANAAQKAKAIIAENNTNWQCTIAEIPDQDWHAKWRESVEPVKVTDTLWVAPEWRPPPPFDTSPHTEQHFAQGPAGERWIKIEPKMAFGTGHHETTRLCSQALVAAAKQPGDRPSLLDIGAGSGILCFVAAHVGYGNCVGIEIDPDCLENLAENRDANDQENKQSFLIGTCNALKQTAPFDVVAMNMIMSRSEPLLGASRGHLKGNGLLVWSGILLEEKQEALEAAQVSGFSLVTELSEGEWWCGTFQVRIDD